MCSIMGESGPRDFNAEARRSQYHEANGPHLFESGVECCRHTDHCISTKEEIKRGLVSNH